VSVSWGHPGAVPPWQIGHRRTDADTTNFGRRLRVQVLLNLRENAPALPDDPPDRWSELDSRAIGDDIVACLSRCGVDAVSVEADWAAMIAISESPPDICVNLAEGHRESARESRIPLVLEWLGVPFTGSSALTHALSLYKPASKAIWAQAGLATPRWRVYDRASRGAPEGLALPLIVKPAGEGSGMGVTPDSIVFDADELFEQVELVTTLYQGPALAEEYIGGQEVTVGIVGNSPRRIVLPPLVVNPELVDPASGGLYTSRVKTSIRDTSYVRSARGEIPAQSLQAVAELALAASDAIDVHDVARVDMRLDAQGRPWVLEVNTLPGLERGFSDLCLAADAANLSHEWLVSYIVNAACMRHGLPGIPIPGPPSSPRVLVGFE
jgi:D-alanine-D-alanine ligase